jgi:hypothetical protein
MNPNTILAIILVLVVLTLFSAMIAGDVFLARIAFNSDSMSCESFIGDVNDQATKTAAATATNVFTAPINKSVRRGTCAELDNVQLGFARFRLVIFWIMFIALSAGLVYVGVGSMSFGTGGIILISLCLILWIFMLVGGIYLSKFAFESSSNKCNNTSVYCYDLNDAEIFFTKVTSIFCFPMTFAVLGTLVYLMYKSI